jgi:23S rRNA (guanosine2251-2'-O)-methyltransferase
MAVERVVGFHPVREALKARRRTLHRLVHRDDPRHPALPELVALATAARVPIEPVAAAALDRGAGGLRHQGLVLEAGPLPSPSLEALLTALPGPAGATTLVMLDGVEDPQNLGAVVRVADASGAAGVVLAARGAPPLSPAVSRASAGAVEHLPVARAPNLRRALDSLRGCGYWAMGADAERGDDLFALPERTWRGDLVLVFGAEGRGLRPGVAAGLDHRVRIPLIGHVASLNVAAAAAVVCFEAARRRGLLSGTASGGSAPGGASARN